MTGVRTAVAVLCLGSVLVAQSPAARDLRRTALAGAAPTAEIVRLDIDGDGTARHRRTLVERQARAVARRERRLVAHRHPRRPGGGRAPGRHERRRWYDGVTDQNVKWADNDGDGRPDLQAWSTQPPTWSDGKWSTSESHWMLFLDVEKDGVLGWQDWRTFNFGNSNWDYTEHPRLAARLPRRRRCS